MAALTELFTDLASTTVSTGGTTAPASGTTETWTVASSASFPAAVTGASQFHVGDPNLPTEIIAVTNVSGTTWSVTRGAEGTTPVVHATGFTVKNVFTAVVGNTLVRPWQSLLIAPSGAVAETFPRSQVVTTKTAGNSGTLYVNAVPLALSQVVSNISLTTGSTAENGGSHGWYALLDQNMIVRAVTADQTGLTAWGASTEVKLAVTAPYTVTASGLYYVGVSITAGTMPTFVGTTGGPSGTVTIAPQLMGQSSTGLTTPLGVGATASTLVAGSTVTAIANFYAYVS